MSEPSKPTTSVKTVTAIGSMVLAVVVAAATYHSYWDGRVDELAERLAVLERDQQTRDTLATKTTQLQLDQIRASLTKVETEVRTMWDRVSGATQRER